MATVIEMRGVAKMAGKSKNHFQYIPPSPITTQPNKPTSRQQVSIHKPQYHNKHGFPITRKNPNSDWSTQQQWMPLR
jgi:hypothetical protein